MPDLLRYAILGLVQGITEFLPISSDGHLAILSHWLEMPGDELSLAVILHLGSLAAIIWAFRRDLVALFARAPDGVRGTPQGRGRPNLLGLIVLASVPIVVVGPLLYPFFVDSFESTALAGAMLVLTGIILLCSRALPDGNAAPDARTAVVMGIAQAFALLPGLSRSALTMTAGFALGVERRQVARFSFLMAIPAIAGANVLELAESGRFQAMNFAGLSIGVIAAFFTSLIAIRLLLGLVRRGRFEWFGAYCLAAGTVALSLS